MDHLEFDDLDELKERVEESGDVLSVRMWTLRDAYGAERLGVNVRQNIERELASRGLAHYPASLPEYQGHAVRVYKQGTPVARLIAALETPGHDQDDIIKSAADGGAQKVLDRIREVMEA